MTESRFLVPAIILCVDVLISSSAIQAPAATEQSSQQLAQATSPSLVGMTPSEAEARTKLEQAGYSNIRNVRSAPEGISATATKDGREVYLVIDSGGSIRPR